MNKLISISAIVAAGLIGASSLTHAQGTGGGTGTTMGSEAADGKGGTTAKDKKMHSGAAHGSMDKGSSMSKSNGSMAQRAQTDAMPAAGGETPTQNKRTDMTKGQGGTSGTPVPATSATGNK